MRWHAVVPLKGRAERKTRLAPHLTPAERHTLTLRLFAHVLNTLRQVPEIAEIAVLCDLRPENYLGRLIADEGRGLNTELTAIACATPARLLILHADLPMVLPNDIAAMLSAATKGSAVASDRHGTGTNALALTYPAAFAFHFGPDSLARHLAQPDTRLVTRPGLALDIDTEADLAAATTSGFT